MGNHNYSRTIAPEYTSFAPSEKKTQAENILMGALLREPFSLPQHMGRLNRTALSFADGNLSKAFIEILDQFQRSGKYSPMTIFQKTGIDVSHFASQFTDIDLGWAVSEWWIEYEKWGEFCAMAAAMSEAAAGDGALSMRGAAENERERLGLNGGTSSISSAEDFMNWGINKLEGNELIYKTVPHMQCVRELIKAFEPGEMWLIAARPSMGKTQAGLNLHSYWYDQGAKGAFVSLEMRGSNLLARTLGVRHGINPIADWSTLDQSVVGKALSETASMDATNPFVNGIFNISEIESWAISAHYRGELEYLILDYLGLVGASGKQQNREREVATISSALTRLALRLNIPVIALSQLSRAVETRGGTKRPQLSDLRDSGSLEQDATGVIFLHRPEYYGVTEDESGQSLKGVAEWIVAKHRNGSTGTAVCAFNPIRGFKDPVSDQSPFSTQFPASQPSQPQPDRFLQAIGSSRPKNDEDIPF